MQTIETILIAYTASDEQLGALRAFARDYAWETPVTDPEYAADVVICEMQADITGHPDAVSRLRAYLEESAEKHGHTDCGA